MCTCVCSVLMCQTPSSLWSRLDSEDIVTHALSSQVLGCQWEHELLVDHSFPNSFCFTSKDTSSEDSCIPCMCHHLTFLTLVYNSWRNICAFYIHQLMFRFADPQINFLIFMKILKVILSKLRANNQSEYPDYKLRQVVSAYFQLWWIRFTLHSVWLPQKSTGGFLW